MFFLNEKGWDFAKMENYIPEYGQVSVAALMHTWNPTASDLCGFCTSLVVESIEHLFKRGDIAQCVWRYFSDAADISPLPYLKQNIRKWWSLDCNPRKKVVYQVVPIVILWFLWMRRNTILHGGTFSRGKLIWEVNDFIRKFMFLRFKVSCEGQDLI
ncbi:hypothetical protein H5410_003606 [Solanum commersonii]|uniref:Uncharacterized protein n=1 Tax=Solanum commersonii TaxID=4109 RepID=A0A9J6B5D1_SOLCO|nr:hypothetical protein H5410_003606 [Solanum commersonii]